MDRRAPAKKNSPRVVFQTNEDVKQEKERLKRKSQLLIDKAEKTFQELTITLHMEQAKLLNLEEKRQRLKSKMMELKADIEKEKESIYMDLESTKAEDDSVSSWYGLTEEELDETQSSIKARESRTTVKFKDLDAMSNDFGKSSAQ